MAIAARAAPRSRARVRPADALAEARRSERRQQNARTRVFARGCAAALGVRNDRRHGIESLSGYGAREPATGTPHGPRALPSARNRCKPPDRRRHLAYVAARHARVEPCDAAMGALASVALR